jgi:formylglycine-generating enzyme required for sulfatase activity
MADGMAEARSIGRQVRIPGGRFVMGDHFGEGYPEDGDQPLHEVTISPFLMDATAVTNASFLAFVAATGYVTEAEQLGLSAVFHLDYRGDPSAIEGRVHDAPWWLVVSGADWRHPGGPGSSIERELSHPVVHVSWGDARAYADWAGRRLPTEAEWEYAARGGLYGARFPWGNDLAPHDRWQMNVWQGTFPNRNTLEDGHAATAPVDAFNANGYGLHQMVGHVWDWCQDWFDASYYAWSDSEDPGGPVQGTSRVLRGGSYLCHASYCHRYRVAARSSNTPESAAANTGFRCASSDV